MADTIIERNVSTDSGDSSAGWAVAVVILIAVIVLGGLYFYYHRTAAPAAPTTGTANINVTIPAPTTGTTGGTTGTN